MNLNTRQSHLRQPKGWLFSLVPAVFWEVTFLILPFLAIVTISFLSRGTYGGVELPWTLENYKRLAGFGLFGFETLYPVILFRSILLALVTASLCAAASIPLCFFIVSLRGPSRIIALVCLTIPIWTNLLVRTYAWQILLGPQSWLSHVAVQLGVIKVGGSLYPGIGAVLLCLICDYLPFAALPLYASVEKLDRALIEAAQDLGASRVNVFRHAIYPQISPGFWAGFLLVLLPALGQFVIPDLLGGGKSILMGNVLQQQFGPSRDWPFGAAFATVAMLLVMSGIYLYSKTQPTEKEFA
jgi:spermidine/putrescine transport system permease protein